MKKFIVFMGLALASGILYASGLTATSLNFIAPQVINRTDVYNPAIGEIVFDATDDGFYGRTASGLWQSFGSAGSEVPVGMVSMFAGATAPIGYLLCDGSTVSRTTYADLFNIIGTTYGAGDGSTTFNLPDMRGIFVRGVGTQTISGITYTGTLGSKQGDQLQGHKHGEQANLSGNEVPYVATNGSGPSIAGAGLAAGAATAKQIYGGTAVTDGTNGTPRTGSETQPGNIALNYIIKY